MRKSGLVGAAVVGLVAGLAFGGVFATALDGADEAVTTEGRKVDNRAAETGTDSAPEDAVGFLDESGLMSEESQPTVSSTPEMTATPWVVRPGPTAVAIAPTVVPTMPSSAEEPEPPSLAPDSETVGGIDIEDGVETSGEDRPSDKLPCDGNYIAITRTAIDSAGEYAALVGELNGNQDTRPASVAGSCPAVAIDDGATYFAYIGPFSNAVDACVTVANLGPDVRVVHLSETADEPIVTCPAVAGFVTHQGQFFVADVPQGANLTDSDRDVGYGFRTRYEGPGYFVTIETSRNDVAETGASAKESAAGVAATVAGASELRQVTIGGTEVWYFEFTDDGYYKVDLFFNLGVDGYAVIGAATSSPDVAFGLASHTVASLQPIS